MNELKAFGLVNVHYPQNLRSIVKKAIDSWEAFCSLSEEDKLTFSFLEDSHGDGAGYELKVEKGNKKDLKENFHVTLFQYERLCNISNTRTFPFLHSAKDLLDHIEPVVLDFASLIEKEYEIEGFVEEVRVSKPYWILRYLHYFGDQEEGKEIAAPHIDKGGFTLHLYESDEGLEYYCIKEKVWKPMPVHSEQTVIIPAAQLQFLSKGKLKGLYHRVIATDKTATKGRFSMVCFIPFENVAKYEKKKHGNMQSHELGFNYAIPHEDFAKLF
jgi:isopenicillin N synthase-like dioxygenase